LPAESQVPEEPVRDTFHDAETPCQRRAAIYRRLVAEHAPVGQTEETLVSELADLSIDLEAARTAKEAAIRAATATFSAICGSMDHQLPQQRPPTAGFPHGALAAPPADTVITAALGSIPVRRAEQRLAQIRKALLDISKLLGKLQAQRRLRDLPRLAASTGITIDVVGRPDTPAAITPRLAQAESRNPDAAGDTRPWPVTAETEADCERMFRDWLRTAGLPCPQCGSQEPPVELNTRRVLQCRCCGGQRGLRTGTFLAHSNISFLAAVQAVRLLALEPQVPLWILCRATGLSPRSMKDFRSRILQAFEDPAQRSSLLAACGHQPEQFLPT
jgi:hypothetical protein